jgi:hypothetical protein
MTRAAQPNRYLTRQGAQRLRHLLFAVLNGARHRRAVAIYLIVVFGHFSEHLVQLAQILLFDVPLRQAGGLLGSWLPDLARSEVLHTGYNSLQLTGLILLLPGFAGRGAARALWIVALIAQSWHFTEHALLQIQFLTGSYLFDASTQTSLLELFLPRIQLHFAYNLLVFVPTFAAAALRFRRR